MFLIELGLSILLVFLIRPITVIIHELGHALPALLLTKGDVEVYIGSYGETKDAHCFRLGRLKMTFKYNPIIWKVGICKYTDLKVGIWSQLVIVLLGPLTSLICGIICLYLFFTYPGSSRFMLFLMFFLVSFMLDFYWNIIPNKTPISLADGSATFNDGEQLRQLIKLGVLPEDFHLAVKYYHDEQYEESGNLCLELLRKGLLNSSVFQMAIWSFIKAENYDKGESVYQLCKDQVVFNSDDYSNIGMVYSKMNKDKEAMAMYEASLELNPNNIYALNNRGFQRILNQDFKAAINDFDAALELDNDMSYALSNRGYARIELGFPEDGLADIEKSLAIDDTNSYAHRNLGIYYLKKKEKQKAIESFRRAFDLDKTTHDIEELMLEAEEL